MKTAIEIAAQVWCHPSCSDIRMNPKLCAVIAEKFRPYVEATRAFQIHLDTMEKINAHMGYQFTQPLMDARKELEEILKCD